MLRSLFVRRLIDLREALVTWPECRTWLMCALIFGAFVATAAPIGLLSGFLRPETANLPKRTMFVIAITIFVQPSLLEEIVFRGFLLPRTGPSIPRRAAAACAALALYVVSHPISAALFRPTVMVVFASPVYLTLAAILGAACTAAYWISKSIWPPVVIHWITVLAWLWFFGGQRMLA